MPFLSQITTTISSYVCWVAKLEQKEGEKKSVSLPLAGPENTVYQQHENISLNLFVKNGMTVQKRRAKPLCDKHLGHIDMVSALSHPM